MSFEIPCCAQMQDALDDSEVPLVSTPKFSEIGICVLDGGTSNILLLYCPWCGNKLPASLRSEWFTALEERKIDPFGENVPREFLDDRWHRVPAGKE